MNEDLLKKYLRDIIKRCAVAPNDANIGTLELQVRVEQKLFEIVLEELCDDYGGWMVMTAFCVAFGKCKKILEAAEDDNEKRAIRSMINTVIGSFGKQLN